MILGKRMVPVMAFVVLASCTALAFTAGCGGDDNNDNDLLVPGANSQQFLGRSYTGTVGIDAGRFADVRVSVSPSGVATGTFTLNSGAVIATGNATGSLNAFTGVFSLNGTYGNGESFTLSGTLPVGTATGTFALSINGQTYTSNFTASGITPTPTASSSPVASPSPSASPVATPTPAPSGTPGANAAARYFPLRTGDTYTYTLTTRVNGATSTSDFITRTGNVVTFNGATAYRQEDTETSGFVTSAAFVNVTDAGYAAYGSEEYAATGAVESSSRFTPPFVIPTSVLNGQAGNFSYTSTVTNSDGTSGTLTFSGTATPQGTETVTVPAGTFTALKLRIQSTITATQDGFSVTTNGDTTEYLVENVGSVKSDTTSSSTVAGITTASTSSEVLKTANVGGRQYP
ncbi:MAG: hypothetical protein H7Y38_06680 [Armatimonadetes bacterium]|nr:hypothetical protein [Armatimonadota bacterium]